MGDIKCIGAQFQVTPEQLLCSVQTMNGATDKAQKEVVRFLALVQETDVCFRGKAKEAFVKKANTLASEWQELLIGLHNNISDLREIAETYEKAEGENCNVVMENDS